MKNQIIELRKQGKRYKEIAEIIGCSHSAISYHLDPFQKEKALKRIQIRRAKNPLHLKIYSFIYKQKSGSLQNTKTETYQFTVEDILNKYKDNPKCYLTGDLIDLNEPTLYSFDHILPESRGGKSTLENLGLTTKEANQAKYSKTPEEFISLCKKVLEHNGYKVTKST